MNYCGDCGGEVGRRIPDGDNRPPLRVEDVQSYVHAALPELRSEAVAVQMIPAKLPGTGEAKDSATGGTDTAGGAAPGSKRDWIASAWAVDYGGITPECVIREGTPTSCIESLVEEDHDIALIILAAGDHSEGPGPLVSAIAGSGGAFSIPVTVVPCSLSDSDIDDLV